MSKIVNITFINYKNNSIIEVPLVTRNHAIAEMWYSKLKDFLLTTTTYNGMPVDPYIETRFSGFRLERRSLPILIEKLQHCVDGINNSWLNTEYGYRIEIDKIPPDYPTHVHNIIHHHFEILMGQSWNPSEWYRKVVAERKDYQLFTYIRGLNDISHEIEEYKVENNFPHLHTTFEPEHCVRKEELPLEAENYFELGCQEGGVYLQYAQLGKTWVEVVHDNDEEIFEDNISPLRIISGEFSICFKGDGYLPSHHLEFLAPKLIELGKDPTDKSLRLGRIIVADVQHPDISEVIKLIESGYDQLYSIQLEDIVKIYPPYIDPY